VWQKNVQLRSWQWHQTHPQKGHQGQSERLCVRPEQSSVNDLVRYLNIRQTTLSGSSSSSIERGAYKACKSMLAAINGISGACASNPALLELNLKAIRSKIEADRNPLSRSSAPPQLLDGQQTHYVKVLAEQVATLQAKTNTGQTQAKPAQSLSTGVFIGKVRQQNTPGDRTSRVSCPNCRKLANPVGPNAGNHQLKDCQGFQMVDGAFPNWGLACELNGCTGIHPRSHCPSKQKPSEAK
jgi:hypothetical protein